MTITAKRWGRRPSVCVLGCKRHIPERAWEKVNEAPAWTERLQNRLPREVRGGDQRWCRGPFCHPGLVRASGATCAPACVCAWITCEWVKRLWWAEQPGELRELSSCHLLSLSPSEASQAQWESLALGSCFPPPPAVPMASFLAGHQP